MSAPFFLFFKKNIRKNLKKKTFLPKWEAPKVLFFFCSSRTSQVYNFIKNVRGRGKKCFKKKFLKEKKKFIIFFFPLWKWPVPMFCCCSLGGRRQLSLGLLLFGQWEASSSSPCNERNTRRRNRSINDRPSGGLTQTILEFERNSIRNLKSLELFI